VVTKRLVVGGGVSVSDGDLLLECKLDPELLLFEQLLLRRLASARAEAGGLKVTDDEVRAGLDEFYAERDLFEDDQIADWCARRQLSEDDIRAHVRCQLLADQLGSLWATEETVAHQYGTSRHDYAVVQIEMVEVESAGLAAELMIQVREGEISWLEAATRCGGMTTGELQRRGAPEEIAAELFSVDPGALVGPVETDEGWHALYRVIARTEPELDEELRAQIRAEICEVELRRMLALEPIRFLE
tara:strand:+ start:3048 stop:3782 length:735 start_codon:yes stop_codon:yes gene_type:complete